MEMNMDNFQNIIDDFLTENEVNMLLTMPEGTQEVTVQDNIGLGPVVYFFFILKAAESICAALREQTKIGKNSEEWEKIVDTMLGMLRRELLPEPTEVSL